MKDVVVIPCFSRPEFLTVCLEQIEKNPEAKDLKYLFAFDAGYDLMLTDIATAFGEKGYESEIQEREGRYVGLPKQSFNVLSALDSAAQMTNRFVFLIEEDVFISNDFFKWHYLAQSQYLNNFCTIGTRNNNREVELTGELAGSYYTTLDYQSLGVCFRKEVITDLITPHATEKYYSNMVAYMANTFPHSTLAQYYAEQDGLIRRIQERSQELCIVFPQVPRAYHAGFYGKNRGKHPGGDFQTKLARVREVCFSNELMKAKAANHFYYWDSTPINLVNPEW